MADLADIEAQTRGSLVVPALENGDLQVITGATPAAMSYCRQVCVDLIDCFREVRVGPLGPSGILKGILSIRDRYSVYHGVTYGSDALEAVVEATKEVSEKWLRALDLMDEAGTRAKLERWSGEISADDIKQLIREFEGE